MGSVVESSTAGATPEARTAVPWQALLIAQESATGASHTQYLAYASPSAAEYSHVYNHVYRSTIPRQYRQGVADAFVLDAQGCIENAHIPHEADPFYKSCLGQARINSLLSGPPTAYGPSYTGQVLDSESQLHIEQDTAPATTGNRQIASDASGFARTCFPLQNSSHRAKRRSLISIINSDWWIQNIFEPDERLLLQFMDYDKHEERWKCSFWEAGDPCQRSCKGKDHAKGHVRFHIQHLPYACEPPWLAVFPAKLQCATLTDTATGQPQERRKLRQKVSYTGPPA